MLILELAYLLIAYGMTGILLYSTRHTTFPTVSHIALHKRLTRLVFFWGLFITAILFGIMLYRGVIPQHDLGIEVKILAGLLILCQILTGFFNVNERKIDAHKVFASILGLSMFTLMTVFAFSSSISAFARTIDGVLAAGMIILLLTSVHVPRGEYLFHEKIFFAFWHAAFFATVVFG